MRYFIFAIAIAVFCGMTVSAQSAEWDGSIKKATVHLAELSKESVSPYAYWENIAKHAFGFQNAVAHLAELSSSDDVKKLETLFANFLSKATTDFDAIKKTENYSNFKWRTQWQSNITHVNEILKQSRELLEKIGGKEVVENILVLHEISLLKNECEFVATYMDDWDLEGNTLHAFNPQVSFCQNATSNTHLREQFSTLLKHVHAQVQILANKRATFENPKDKKFVEFQKEWQKKFESKISSQISAIEKTIK